MRAGCWVGSCAGASGSGSTGFAILGIPTIVGLAAGLELPLVGTVPSPNLPVDLSLGWFLPVTGWSVIFAWVVTRTGSFLLAVLLHAPRNTTLGTLGVLILSDVPM